MGKQQAYVMGASELYSEDINPELKNLRDVLEYQFNQKINLLLESKRPRKSYSTKGKLCSRKLYQTPFNDNVFKKHLHVPSSDTTIVFLIDASGSMENVMGFETGGHRYELDRLEACNAVVSAFANSINKVVDDQIKIEVFTKTSADIESHGLLGIKGSFPHLTRVYSNSTKSKKATSDRILKILARSPMCRKYPNGELRGIGSSTPEYAVLPALHDWIKKNITTKNVVVFNLTDGDTYCSLGYQSSNNSFTKMMREKYLRHIDNITLYIDGEADEYARSIYGDNLIGTDGDFVSPMFNELIKIFNKSVQ
tara:strand:+ start:1882 stop:2811 length:930 start_codon:yes stop_codon:yes gene_type:complete